MRNRSMGSLTGGRQTDGTVEERLTRRFQAELARAERDYPRLRFLAEREEGRSFRRSWPRLQTVVIGASALTIAGLVAMSFAWRGQGEPAASGSLPAGVSQGGSIAEASGAAGAMAGLATNGLPTHYNGDPVYQLWEEQSWRAIDGSFLLAGYKWSITNACPSGAAATPAASGQSADGELVPVCSGTQLSPTPGNYTKSAQELAPLGSESVAALADGTAVVVWAHTRDPLSSECTAMARAACDQAVVVDAIVWQGGPSVRVVPDRVVSWNRTRYSYEPGRGITAIDGVRVYLADDELPTAGSFLLGGWMRRSLTSCATTPAPVGPIVWPGCGQWTLDGHQMVQSSADLGPLMGHFVVMRVYGAGGSTVCLNGDSYCRVLAAVEIVMVAS